ncbi:hypothetical protein Drorol1_Dr00018280 [Drosera rotundifolia]
MVKNLSRYDQHSEYCPRVLIACNASSMDGNGDGERPERRRGRREKVVSGDDDDGGGDGDRGGSGERPGRRRGRKCPTVWVEGEGGRLRRWRRIGSREREGVSGGGDGNGDGERPEMRRKGEEKGRRKKESLPGLEKSQRGAGLRGRVDG